MFAWLVTSRSGFLILVQSNCLGAILGAYYVRTFYLNCRSEQALVTLQKYMSAVTALALLQVCAICVLPAERSLFLTGCLSSFCGFVSAASMLVVIPQIIRTKDSSNVPGPFIIATLISSMVWVLCGWLLDDPLVVGPNLFAVVASSLILYLKAKYDKGPDPAEKVGPSLLEAALTFTRENIFSGHSSTLGGTSPRKRPAAVKHHTSLRSGSEDELAPLMAASLRQTTAEAQAEAGIAPSPTGADAPSPSRGQTSWVAAPLLRAVGAFNDEGGDGGTGGF